MREGPGSGALGTHLSFCRGRLTYCCGGGPYSPGT